MVVIKPSSTGETYEGLRSAQALGPIPGDIGLPGHPEDPWPDSTVRNINY